MYSRKWGLCLNASEESDNQVGKSDLASRNSFHESHFAEACFHIDINAFLFMCVKKSYDSIS